MCPQVVESRSLNKAEAGGENSGAIKIATKIEIKLRRFTHETYQIDLTS